MNTVSATIVALALLTGSAFAQTASTTATADPIAQKFATLDADKSGFLDGTEISTFKDKIAVLDMDKDGKVSPNEFNMGVMTGVIAK